MRSSFFFSDFIFYKEALCSFVHTFIMFKHINVVKHIWKHTSKIKKKKNMLTLKFHPGRSAYTSFFLVFTPGWNFIPIFYTGMSSHSSQRVLIPPFQIITPSLVPPPFEKSLISPSQCICTYLKVQSCKLKKYW